MGLIKVKVKVKLISEEDLEWDEETMGKVYKDPTWVWRNKILDTQYFFELTEFTQNKTILQQTDGTLLLVAESIDSLYKLWEEHKEEDLDLGEVLSEDDLEEGEDDNAI